MVVLNWESNEKLYAGPARNIAWQTASSDIVTFIDADDEMYPERIEVLHNFFADHGDLQLLMHEHSMASMEQHHQNIHPKYGPTPLLHTNNCNTHNRTQQNV